MNYKKLQENFESEVRQLIKEINSLFVVNIHTYPKIYIDFQTPSVSFNDEEQDRIEEYIKQIDQAYEIINKFICEHKI